MAVGSRFVLGSRTTQTEVDTQNSASSSLLFYNISACCCCLSTFFLFFFFWLHFAQRRLIKTQIWRPREASLSSLVPCAAAAVLLFSLLLFSFFHFSFSVDKGILFFVCSKLAQNNIFRIFQCSAHTKIDTFSKINDLRLTA